MSAGPKTQLKSRTPKCSRCQYHGVSRDLKGHKRFCPYQDCLCSKCKLNVARRKIMAAQLAIRQHELEQEMRASPSENTKELANVSSADPMLRMPPTTASSSNSFLHNMVLHQRQNDQHLAMHQIQMLQGQGCINPSDPLLRMPQCAPPNTCNATNYMSPSMVLQHHQNDNRLSHTVHHMMLDDKNSLNLQPPHDKGMSQHLMSNTTALPPYHPNGYI